ncbi:MAG: TonB-dependent receptor [Phycisphaerae bacterium]|nr:TonB-dependent receptor [Gemmatimonadaceae bacterium]
MSVATLMLVAHGTTLAAQPRTTTLDRSAQDRAKRDEVAAQRRLGTIDGVVTDTMLSPLGAADVSVVGVGARVVTSDNGRFRILQVPAGQYLLVVRRIGYAPTSGIIDVPATDTLRLSYTLSRSRQVLDTIRVRERRVSLRMAAFEMRRRQAIGQFVTQEEIDARGSQATADFMRRFRGVQISTNTTQVFGGTQIYSRREGGGYTADGQQAYCPMQVMLDGILLPSYFNLDLLPPPKQISGIEVYNGPSTIPPQFGGVDRRCGLVAVWTRDGY